MTLEEMKAEAKKLDDARQTALNNFHRIDGAYYFLTQQIAKQEKIEAPAPQPEDKPE